MKKVVIVNCFDTYEDRVDLIHEFFREKGYEVTVIQSDFRHFKKNYRDDSKKDFIFVKSNPYYKNLSFARLYSHYKFAGDAFKIVEKIKPDLLYTLVPPNSLAKFSALYKKRYKEIKLILDLIDLWPETMPIGKAKKFPPFRFWGAMRDNSFKYADIVITECNLYHDVLRNVLKGIKTETLYLAKREIDVVSNPQLNDDIIHLAYLGSINNIIDITKIKEIIEAIKKVKPVTLHIIGDGERKQELIDEAEASGAVVIYHGKIYNPQEKQEIFDKCHFGLNIMKNNVCVGLTMKSIEYFQHGLPIINNIPADTANLVEKYGVGININQDIDMSELYNNMQKIIVKKKENGMDYIKHFYKEMFSTNSFKRNLEKIINKE